MSSIFKPATERIAKLALIEEKRLMELKKIFNSNTNVYIDYANVLHWSSKLKWHIDLKRLKQLINSFTTVKQVRLYQGTLVGDELSERTIKEVTNLGYLVKTKPVKIMKISIDVSSVPANSPAILQNFIDRALLSQFTLETIEYLNARLKELNTRGIHFLEHKKCNFDVEIGRDMLLDYASNDVDNFALWSGDSDFADPVLQLMKDGKKVVIFGTSRRISVELAQTKALIFDIAKIKNFICYPKEMDKAVAERL